MKEEKRKIMNHEKEDEGEEESQEEEQEEKEEELMRMGRRSYCFPLSSSLHFFKFIEHCLDVRMFVQ